LTLPPATRSFVGVTDKLRTGCAYGAIGLVAAALFALRLSVPMDLLAYAQDMPAMYVLDAVVNGHWLCQRDALGAVTSKPPLYTWLAALASLPAGRVTWFSLCLPSGLATLGTAWVILTAGRKWWNRRAGMWAALVYLISPMAGKQVALVRTDPLFTFTVALTAMAAFAAWERGRGWTWFWLAAAAATLTKGPLGLALGAAGLAAAWWESRSGSPAPLRGRQAVGVALYGVLTVGWFALALATEGRDVLDKMILRELLGHAAGAGSDAVPLTNAYKPPLYLLGRFAPWSVLTCVGLWRLARRPAEAAAERRFERFLCCWLGLGLVLFSIGAHVRADLEMPLIPAAALLAGRELDRWTSRLSRTVAVGLFLALAAAGLAIMPIPWVRPPEPVSVQQTRGMKELAGQLTRQVGAEFPFTYVDRTFALQFFLGTMRERVPPERAARLLAEPTPVFVVARRSDRLPVGRVYELARWPAEGEAYVSVLSNHPRLEWTEKMAFGVGPFTVHTERMRLQAAHKDALWFATDGAAGVVRIINESDSPQKIRLRLTGPGVEERVERLLPPGEAWVEDIP
jgi:4-amino-4-deoxy-L-arabinose transferase-like glycosyltransferase